MLRPSGSPVSRSSSLTGIASSTSGSMGISTLEVSTSQPVVRLRSLTAGMEESLLAVLQRATGYDSETLKKVMWGTTLSQRFVPADFERPISDLKFPEPTWSMSSTPVENLIVLIPRDLVMQTQLQDDSILIAGSVPPLSTLTNSSLKDLLYQCSSIFPLLESVFYRLSRLLWTPTLQDQRSRLLPAQLVLDTLRIDDREVNRLCDEADNVFIEMKQGKSWLNLFDESSIRRNLTELVRIVSGTSTIPGSATPLPRSSIDWRMPNYPIFPLNSQLYSQLQSRLVAAVAQIGFQASGASDLSTSIRQSTYETVRDAMSSISTVANLLVITLANSRQDCFTWSTHQEHMEREATLVLDYQRMIMAKETARKFQDELNFLKTHMRRHQRFTENYLKLLPSSLALIYQDEYNRAIGVGSSRSGSASFSSRSFPASPSSSTFSPSSSVTNIESALMRSQQEMGWMRRIKELEEDRSKRAAELEEERRLNFKLAGENSLLKSTAATVPQHAQMQMEDLRRKISGLEASYAVERDQLTNQLTEANMEISTAGTEVSLRQKQVESLSKSLAQADLVAKSLQRSLEESQVREMEQRAALEAQSQLVKETEERYKRMESDFGIKSAELEEMKKKADMLQLDLSVKEAVNLQLTDEVDTLKRDKSQSHADAALARKLFEEASPGIAPESAELHSKDKDHLVKMVLHLRSLVLDHGKDTQMAIDVSSQLQVENHNLRNQLRAVQEMLSSYQSQLSALRSSSD